MKSPAVFFDRDGTLIVDKNYLKDPGGIEFIKGAPECIAALKKAGYKIIIISNQSGIARGLLTHSDVSAIHSKINKLLKDMVGTEIDAFYYCPHHPDFNTADECLCRKPSPKMVLKAAAEHNIDLDRSFFVGDKDIDVECGINANLPSILFGENINTEMISNLKNAGKIPKFISSNFDEICRFILNYNSEENSCGKSL
ncbi:MAG TPA: HAD family hydrolase [Ignavibacteriales bacterium]|nr:HAD family hydrolase [Ignavibacteriales bacterium]